jgi:hypothetical protein
MSGRPPHPLFGGGGGAASALAAAAAEMEKKRATKPSEDPRPSGGKVREVSGPSGGASSGSRPPHPMFGSANPLNDQIKAMAAKRSERVAAEGISDDPVKAKKSIDAVMPPSQIGKSGGSMQTASMADQVAMMAEQRRRRMEDGGDGPKSAAPTDSSSEIVTVASPRPVPVAAPAAPTPVVKKVADPPAKKGFFGGKKDSGNSTTKTTVKHIPAPPKPQSTSNEPPKPKKIVAAPPPPVTPQPVMLATRVPEQTPVEEDKATDAPLFSQARLRKVRPEHEYEQEGGEGGDGTEEPEGPKVIRTSLPRETYTTEKTVTVIKRPVNVKAGQQVITTNEDGKPVAVQEPNVCKWLPRAASVEVFVIYSTHILPLGSRCD